MQDRFKIRAWDEETKSYFNPLDSSVNGLVLSIQGISGNFDMYGQDLNSDKFIMEQCTGLKDKNGNLIYEGDILQSIFKNNESESSCLPVYYNKNKFSVGFNGGDAEWFSDYFVGDIEVVGNIHENPELLEGK